MRQPVPLDRFLRRHRERKISTCVVVVVLFLAVVGADRHGWFLWTGDGTADLSRRSWKVKDVAPGPVLQIIPAVGPGAQRRVRLVGLSTSCGVEPGAHGAGHAIKLIRRHLGSGEIRFHPVGSGTSGAIPVSVHAWGDGGVLLNEALLVRGCCCAAVEVVHRQHDRYVLLEDQARRDSVGIWSRSSAEMDAP